MATIKEKQIEILQLQKALTSAQSELRQMQIDEQIAKIQSNNEIN